MLQLNKIIPYTKNGEIRVSRKDNAMVIEYINCEQNPKSTGVLTRALLPEIKLNFNYKKTLFTLGTFEQSIADITYWDNVHETLDHIRCGGLQKDSKPIEIFKMEIRAIRSRISDLISKSKFSYPQKLVLGNIGDIGFDELSEYDLRDFYNAKKLSLSPKLDKLLAEVNSFDYKTYDCDKTVLAKDLNEKVTDLRLSIEEFERLVKKHGDDLVNWGPHRFTREGVKNYTVRDWAGDYAEKLIADGVIPKEKKKAGPKVDTLQKSRDAVDKTQEDYLRIFKWGTTPEAASVFKFLNKESVKILIEKPTEAASDNTRSYKESLTQKYCEDDNGDNFQIIRTFAKGKYYHSQVSLPRYYLNKAVDKQTASREELRECLEEIKEVAPISDALYDFALKGLDAEFAKKNRDGLKEWLKDHDDDDNFKTLEVLNLSELITDAIMTRMTNDEVIYVIKRMAGCRESYLQMGLDFNAVGDDEDDHKLEVSIDESTVEKFDSSIYPEIKDFILAMDSNNGGGCFTKMVIDNKDKSMAKKLLEERKGDPERLEKFLKKGTKQTNKVLTTAFKS